MSDLYGPVVHLRCKPGEEVRVVRQSNINRRRAVGIAIKSRDKLIEAVDLLEHGDVMDTEAMVRLDAILQQLRKWIGTGD